ncbi:G-box binding factor, variant 3 [Bonamia ostreae]|uniref:G-box binding factor, variant 3 n=1 Tax=Bonamia ostreae TaxID=126728 RepID=A0ABV2APW1_9EUKA
MMATGLIRLQNENEHVLMKRIEVILDFTRSSLGSLLTDREIYDLFKICLKTAISNSNSPLLRIYAENVSNQSILFLFSRLHSKKFTETAQSPKNGKRTAFGLKAINSLMILLTELLNPYRTDLDNDENIMRYQLLGLKLIHTALESGGKEMSENELTRNVISDDLCKQLLHCSQTDNSRILSMCLRIVFILFNTSRKTLKTQLEIFITSVHIRIAESKFRSLELKELVFESLNEFANEPDLIAGIFRNYDCELKNNNVFEDIARILSEFALKSVGFDGKGEEKRSFLQVCEISGDALIATMRSIEKQNIQKQREIKTN